MTGAPVILPRIARRRDLSAVLVSTWSVADGPSGLGPVPPEPAAVHALGLSSMTGFLSTTGDTVLVYGQATGEPGVRARPGAVEYRLERSVVLAEGEPACVVVATFDVDGPGRQRSIINAIADALVDSPQDRHPGMLSANFHSSVDGSRVLNYAEWTSEAEHVAFLEGATRVTTLRISTTTPGVRPIGFTRYLPTWTVLAENEPS